jgi:hypothetical protein
VQEAVAALRAALEVRRRDVVPFDWARTQGDLAEALVALADLDEAAEPGAGAATMALAAAAAEAALEELPAQQVPEEHARNAARLARAREGLAAHGRAGVSRG